MSEHNDDQEAESSNAAPPQPLPPGWYADPEVRDGTTLRYWDGTEWTGETANVGQGPAVDAHTRGRKPKAPKKNYSGFRRSRVIITLAVLAIIATGSVAIGFSNLAAASRVEDQTQELRQQISTLEEEIDEINAK